MNMDINGAVKVYDEVLRSALQEMAPIMTKQVKIKKKPPWLSSNIKNGISERCKLEREWKKDHDDTNKFIDFYRKCREVDNMMGRAERSYYLSSLNDNRFNIKKIYTIYDDLLGKRKELPLPPADSKQALANRFNKFFTEKIEKIRDHLMELVNVDSFTPLEVMNDNMANTTSMKLEVFCHVSLQEVIETIMKSPTKSCEVDPVPTELIKDNIETISPSFRS